MTPGVLVISKQASLRDLERACFVWRKKRLSSHRTSKQICSGCSHPLGGSRVFVGDRDGRATPLCKQLTLAAVEGWGRAWLACSPGRLPSGWGGKKQAGRKKRRWDQNGTFGLHLSLSPQQRKGRRGEPETGGPTSHQLALQPASAHSQDNFPASSSSLLRQLKASCFLSS